MLRRGIQPRPDVSPQSHQTAVYEDVGTTSGTFERTPSNIYYTVDRVVSESECDGTESHSGSGERDPRVVFVIAVRKIQGPGFRAG